MTTPLLVDTSAWIEFLRATGSPVHLEVRRLIQEDARLATTDVVIMELLAGGLASGDRSRLWALMNRCVMLPTTPLFDYERAARLYVLCRAGGFTPSNSNDLLVAAVAIGRNSLLLAADRDFEQIAAVSSLRLAA